MSSYSSLLIILELNSGHNILNIKECIDKSIHDLMEKTLPLSLNWRIILFYEDVGYFEAAVLELLTLGKLWSARKQEITDESTDHRGPAAG